MISKIEVIPFSDTLIKAIFESVRNYQKDGPAIWKDISEIASGNDPLIYPVLKSTLFTNFNAGPFRSIFRIAARFGTNRVFLEKPYMDLEFWEAFSHFYSRSFSPISKECVRIHFFKVDQLISNNDLVEYFMDKDLGDRSIDYIGFLTLRPTSSFNVGRTALVFDWRPGDEVGGNFDDKKLKPFCHTMITREANLLNRHFTVSTVPFMQQDPIIGVCASTAVWVCSEVMASNFDLAKYTYPQISSFAFESEKNFSEGKEFIRGLDIHEIRRSISKTGANHHILMGGDKGAINGIKNTVYSLIESKIPCIACLDIENEVEGHAVAVISHSLPNTISHGIDLPGESKNYIGNRDMPNQYFISDFISRFNVHDDAYGPYNRLTFKGDVVNLDRKYDVDYDLFALIIPIPPYVKNLPDSVADISQEIMAKFLLPDIQDDNPSISVLWRLFLVEATRFKQSLKSRGYSPALRRKYASIHMPKFVWLAEFTLFDSTDQNSIQVAVLNENDERDIDGEFIFDSTYPTYSRRSISFRYGHMLATSKLEEEKDREKVRDIFNESILDSSEGEPRQICYKHPDV